MSLVTELELPELDYLDESLRGARFHARMAELRREGWLATTPLGFVVLDHESVGFFLRTRSATFPGHKIGELFGIEDGPLHEELMHNILCIDGDDHRRLRNLVNPALTPRAADRYRPAMREFITSLTNAVADAGACDFRQAIRLLAERPARWELRARAGRSRDRRVEELSRSEQIRPFTASILKEEVSFSDVTFSVDTVILCSAFSANRDGAGAGEDGAARGD